MLVLITNDDGYLAPGIQSLIAAMEPDHEVWMVAPDREQSGSSHKLTLSQPLRIVKLDERRYSVDGTPTDTVYMAVHHLMPRRPDLVLSGINRGPNLGDDVTYSGTVAAAMEGTVLGIPSIALSLAGFSNLDYTASCQAALQVVDWVVRDGLPAGTLLNVNIPVEAKSDDLKLRITKLGKRNYGQYVIERKDPRGRSYFWIGGDAQGSVPMNGSDIDAVAAGFVTVTPLSIDLTDTATLSKLKHWETL